MSTISDHGAQFEERIARYLREQGFADAERIREKHPDRGDLGGIPGWTTEAKSVAPGKGTKCPECLQPRGRFDMAAAMDQAAAARAVNGDPYSMVIRQRKSAAVGRTYVIVELSQQAAIIRRLMET